MNQIVSITIIGLLAGIVGTGSGGIIAFFLKRPGPGLLSFFLGFSGGIMLAIVLMDLVPEAIEAGNFSLAIIGLILGAILILLLDLRLPHFHLFEGPEEANSYIRTGVLLGLGIALHNLPEGLAIGSGFVASPSLGISLALTIAIHNVPEGIAMACPLSVGGLKVSRVFLYVILAGLPMGIGAFIGASIGTISPAILSLSLSCAGGAMLYIIFNELIPGSQEMAKGQSGTIGAVFGTIVGILILALV